MIFLPRFVLQTTDIGINPNRKGLSRIANNMRFLILPEVKVPHLASHLLGRISRCVSMDWNDKYGPRRELGEGRYKRVHRGFTEDPEEELKKGCNRENPTN